MSSEYQQDSNDNRDARFQQEYHSLYEQNQDLTKEIQFASALQKSMLQSSGRLDKLFPESFVLYEPCAILSGDFYWTYQNPDFNYVAIGDCTGHGIRAAMLSMLGLGLLNNVMHDEADHPSEILQELDSRLLQSFHGQEDEGSNNDWIDISLVRIGKKDNTMVFAGANRKIMIIYRGIPLILSGSKYPIAGWQINTERLFPYQELKLKKGDSVYLASDGFQDQLGGSLGRKYTSKKFHKLLVKMSEQPMPDQLKLLGEELQNWKGLSPLNDDVSVIGFRV